MNNLPLEAILNMRDLGTAAPSHVMGSHLYRCGCVSKASKNDVALLRDELGVGCFIDLRSQPELEEDEGLNSEVYEGFGRSVYDPKSNVWAVDDSESVHGKMRYFISVMSESVVMRGIFFRLRKRDKAQVLLWKALSGLSPHAEHKMKTIFVDYVNAGGLILLNELVIEHNPHMLVEVLKIAAQEAAPVAYYCTAGKDRTGLISMLLLAVLGATDEDIVADYVLSDGAYRALDDKKAMVASLKQADLDPDVFLTAQPHVILHTLAYVRAKFGSVEAFLDSYGFEAAWRRRLREKAGAGGGAGRGDSGGNEAAREA
jgi:protein tyrosine/serine phosphatase